MWSYVVSQISLLSYYLFREQGLFEQMDGEEEEQEFKLFLILRRREVAAERAFAVVDCVVIYLLKGNSS